MFLALGQGAAASSWYSRNVKGILLFIHVDELAMRSRAAGANQVQFQTEIK